MFSKATIQIQTAPSGVGSSSSDRPLGTICSSSISKLEDHALCREAQQGISASEERLWLKNYSFIRNLVLRQILRYGLSKQEVPDALQESYFAFHHAVVQYHPELHCKYRPASFKTFLQLILTRKLSNYCSRRRFHLKHVIVGGDGEILKNTIEEGESAGYTGKNQNNCLDDLIECLEQTDFADAACCDRFLLMLYQLRPKEKSLMEVWLQYGRDRDVGRILGISGTAAKLRRERLFRRLRECLQAK